MRAVLHDHHGPAGEVLRVEDVEPPEPGPGQVRVKIEVSGINPTDWKSRSGATARPIAGFQIPHHDGAGVIDAVGEGVDPGRTGQRAWVMLAAAGSPWGTAAEWTVVPQEQALPLPDSASFELGASLGVPAVTAYRCLFADGPIAGRTVLVAGGAGAVGHYAIELAKRAGARVVTTVSGPQKADLAIKAGDAGVHRVVEVALGANQKLDLAVIGPDARIVCYAAEPTDPTLAVRACMNANVVLRFVLLYGVPRQALAEAARDITAAVAAGALTELPVTRFPLDQTAAAHDAVEAGTVGKVLVIPG
jgi:NADPH2:quinone reductase